MNTRVIINGKKYFLLLGAIFCCFSSRAQLAGDYTIDPNGSGSSNFKSFMQAVNELTTKGVAGPVVFNVADGSYLEQLTIPPIPGASNLNTITFQSQGRDSTKVRVWNTTSDNNVRTYVIRLMGADYITFKQMTFERVGNGQYARVIGIEEGSTNISFLNNRIIGVKTPYSDDGTLVYSGSRFQGYGSNDNNNSFIRNAMRGGTAGFFLHGNKEDSLESGTVIEYNDITDISSSVITLEYQDAPVVRFNKITNSAFDHGGGISLSFVYNALRVEGNYLNVPDCSFGMNYFNCISTVNARGTTFNNIVIAGGDGKTTTTLGMTSFCMRISFSAYQDILFNTFNNTSQFDSSVVFFHANYRPTSEEDIRVYNNMFVNSGGGYSFCYYTDSINCLPKLAYNNHYTTGNTLGKLGKDSSISDLATWQNVTGYDLFSNSIDPQFISSVNLEPQNPLLNNKATPIAGITTDFYGKAREKIPDIGAIEFLPLFDLSAITGILLPNNVCGDSASILGVVVTNKGETDTGNFMVYAEVTGASTDTFAGLFSESLKAGESDTFYFSRAFNTYNGGAWTVQAWVDGNDSKKENDTSRTSLSRHAVPYPKFYFNSACAGGTVVFKNQSSIGEGSGIQKYTWDFGDGSSFEGEHASHVYDTIGEYVVTLKTESSKGCSQIKLDTVTIGCDGIEQNTGQGQDIEVFPNPFRGSAIITYMLDKSAHVKLEVYDLQGRRVSSLVNGMKAAGEYKTTFDATGMQPGVYIYKLQAGESVKTERMILVD